jgi:hypothetical protein
VVCCIAGGSELLHAIHNLDCECADLAVSYWLPVDSDERVYVDVASGQKDLARRLRERASARIQYSYDTRVSVRLCPVFNPE